jgi:negative regulator of sigma E activity
MDPQNEFEKLERALYRAGETVPYPPTPALAARVRANLENESHRRVVRSPRYAFAIIVAIVLAIVLLVAFPDAREAIGQMLGLRSIQIIPVTPTPTLSRDQVATPTSFVAPTPSQCCETTLADAQARSKFKILLPSNQTPSRIFFQTLADFGSGAQQIILVYGDPRAPRFTMYQATNFLYGKIVSGGTVIEETQVAGQRALWMTGAPHLLVTLDARGQPRFDMERSVTANTLAWEMGDVTFRLETDLSKEEAIRFAESLH